MKQAFLILYIFISTVINAQEKEKGIRFEQVLNWEQIKEKARVENKYIFLDCFTTWCGPCREMEKNVYPLEQVGNFFNEHFISVKVQMDTTLHDDEEIRHWYIDAQKIASEYTVNSYPTFLFFSPDGKIVHRTAGGYPATKFIMLAKDALVPSRQYYTLLASYHPENMSLTEMKKESDSLIYSGPELAKKIAVDYLKRLDTNDLFKDENLRFLLKFHDAPFVEKLADVYINRLAIDSLKSTNNQVFVAGFRQLSSAKKLADQYMASLTDSGFYNIDNIRFISQFIENSTDKSFAIFYTHSSVIDETISVGYAEKKIASIIKKEEIDPFTAPAMGSDKNPEPNWGKIFKKIQKKYGIQFAGYSISLAKYNWYSFKGNHREAFKSWVLLFDKYGKSISSAWDLNNAAFMTFLKSKDTAELKVALSWSERAVCMEPVPYWMDTYANLLYKLGQSNNALKWETIAVKLDPGDKILNKVLNEMKNGEPTWPKN
ncbi:MAG TPA: thioredoxin fold domain-containing protein [Chitinophagaceae bacterium]|nr:thioredoxin fold domain-containing protein [Chitinophagaceae bacterium]